MIFRGCLNLTNKRLKKKVKFIASSNVSIYYIWKNVKKAYKNNKSKISVLAWNEKFELPHGSFYISDIQDCF